MLQSQPMLTMVSFWLHTDVSTSGLDAVLYQRQDDGTDCVIAYASHTLSKARREYDAHELEFLALKLSNSERFHEYLYGGQFKVFTDNNLLTYVLITTKLYATGQQWVAELANYYFNIHYHSRRQNVDADALSHIKWEDDGSVTALEEDTSRAIIDIT